MSVCTEPGGVTLRRAVDIDPEASLKGLCMLRGVLNSAGCSLGSVNSSGGYCVSAILWRGLLPAYETAAQLVCWWSMF